MLRLRVFQTVILDSIAEIVAINASSREKQIALMEKSCSRRLLRTILFSEIS